MESDSKSEEKCNCPCHNGQEHRCSKEKNKNTQISKDDNKISVIVHEDAIVASFKKISNKYQLYEMENVLSEQMKELAKECKKAGALVGHIKAAIREYDNVSVLSLTKDVVHIKRNSNKLENETTVSFVAIIINIDEKVLKDLLINIYHKI